MYNLRRLASVAREGLGDLGPAVRQAFNADPGDDRMDLVYGRNPRRAVLGLGLGCVLAGELFARAGGGMLPLSGHVHWPAVLAGLVFAAAIRRYLFRSGRAGTGDFDWLAASVVPAFVLVIVLSLFADLVFGAPQSGDFVPVDPGVGSVELGSLFLMLTDSLGIAAALSISVATLCFSRKWPSALLDLAVRLFLFRLMVWITAIVLLEVDVVSTIVGALLEGLIDWRLPEWLSELADQVSYAAILTTAYLAVIGGTWMVCKRSFAELLGTGQVNVLIALEELARDPEAEKKKKEKKQRKQARKQKRGP